MNPKHLQKLSDMFSLEGKVAAITGAGGVLMSAVAKGMAEIGVKTAVLDLRLEAADKTAEAIRAAGGEAMAAEADVLNAESVTRARDSILEKYSRIDILINGAGGNHPKATTKKETGVHFADLSLEGIRFTFDLNILGTVIPSMVFSQTFIKQGEGVILNTSSMNAETPLTRIVAYSAAKAGVSNFTKWLATDMALNHSPKIRVNEIRPGFFPTIQNAELINQTPGNLTETRGNDILGRTPMKRYGLPEELIGALVFLCSPSASFITGAAISIDGGFGAFTGV